MDSSSTIKTVLINNSPVGYSSEKLELYKLYIGSANDISSKRLISNTFFLTINTGIMAFASYLDLFKKTETETSQYGVIAVSGIVLCYIWYRLIKSYKDLNSAKFKVIHLIEEDLPYKLFDAEWEAVGRGEDEKKYLPFTKIEMYVPWVFLALHIFVFIKSLF